MDYKKEIIEMIEKITKPENISMLYGAVKTMVEYEDQKEKKAGANRMNDNIDYKEEIKKLLEKAKEPYTFKRVYKLLEYLYLQEPIEETEAE